jgi:hypothetical protein
MSESKMALLYSLMKEGISMQYKYYLISNMQIQIKFLNSN